MADIENIRARIGRAALQPGFDGIVDKARGAPGRVRAVVGSVDNSQDRLATMRNFYPEAMPFGPDNFIFIDRETQRLTLYNPPGFFPDAGDIASIAPEVGETIGGALGGAAVAGPALATAPATGGLSLASVPVAVGLGAGAGREFAQNVLAPALGPRVDRRDISQRMADAALTVGMNTAGQRVGEIAEQGVKRAIGAARNRLTRSAPAATLTDFARAGVEPRSAGAVTGNRGIQILEQGVGETIAGGEVVARAAKETLDEVSARVTALADEVSPVRTRAQAGANLKRGAAEFLEGFRATKEGLEAAFARKVPADRVIGVSNTQQALAAVGDVFTTNPELGKSLVDPQFQKWLDILERGGGKLSFAELRRFRTFIGDKLSTPQIMNDIPRADLKRLYAGMTDDLRSAAEAQGRNALTAFDRATRFERQGFQRIENALTEVLSPDSKVSVERVFTLINDLAQERGKGANLRKLALLRRSVGEDRWRASASVVLRRMGMAKPGVQDVQGEVFSASTFLTEWNKLDPRARRILFNGTMPDGWVDAVDSLTRVVGALKDLDRRANTSGTARVLQAMGMVSGIGAIGGAAITGDVEGAATGAAALTTGRILAPAAAAKLMSNPRFVRFLVDMGRATINNPNSAIKTFTRLVSIAKAEPEIREEIRLFVDTLRPAPAGSAPSTAGE